jgi:hypothetical protein
MNTGTANKNVARASSIGLTFFAILPVPLFAEPSYRCNFFSLNSLIFKPSFLIFSHLGLASIRYVSDVSLVWIEVAFRTLTVNGVVLSARNKNNNQH